VHFIFVVCVNDWNYILLTILHCDCFIDKEEHCIDLLDCTIVEHVLFVNVCVHWSEKNTAKKKKNDHARMCGLRCKI
jgi:hypothetical protein